MKRYEGKYVDSFVVPIPADRLDDYRALAELAGRVWREHGALEYVECIADNVKPGKVTSYPQAVDLKDGEIVVIAWAVYHSREHRDEVMAKVFADDRMKPSDPSNMPFDAMRMFWGGFKVLLEA